ncbi:hypothetical protein COBT_002140 [Conglomerata obtusa]
MEKYLKGFIAFIGMFLLANLVYISYIGVKEFVFDQTSIANITSNNTNESSRLFYTENVTIQVDQATKNSFKTNIDKVEEALDKNETETKIVKNITSNPYRGQMQDIDSSLNIHHATTSTSKIKNTTGSNTFSTIKNSTHFNPNIIVYDTDNNFTKTLISSKTPKPDKTKTSKAKLPQLNKVNTNNIGIKKTTETPRAVSKHPQNEFKYDPTYYKFYYCDFKMESLRKAPKLYAYLANYYSPNTTFYKYFNRYMQYNDVITLEDNSIKYRISLVTFKMRYNTSLFYNEHAVLVINEHEDVGYIDYGTQRSEKKIFDFYNIFQEQYPDWCIIDLNKILKIIYNFPQLIFFDVYLEHLNECKKGTKSVTAYEAPIVSLIKKTQVYILEQKESKKHKIRL